MEKQPTVCAFASHFDEPKKRKQLDHCQQVMNTDGSTGLLPLFGENPGCVKEPKTTCSIYDPRGIPRRILEELRLSDERAVSNKTDSADDDSSRNRESKEVRERKEEDERIRILVNTPAFDWFSGGGSCVGSGGKRQNYRTKSGRPNIKPPEGYVCRRCHVVGHLIQHCPTNGDPQYDLKRVRVNGIPKSMLVADKESSYVLFNGEVTVVKPDEQVFEKEMECIPSKRRLWFTDGIPPDLLCSLCKKVMRDATMTSRCCFKSFCDKCIRDQLMNSKLKCECGATGILTDYLVPNITVRHLIDSILECGFSMSSGSSSSDTKCISLYDQK